MQNDRNNDYLFREKLIDLEKTPPPEIWDGLQSELIRQKKVLRLRRFAGGAVAAAIVLITFIMWWQIDNNSQKETEIVKNVNPKIKLQSSDVGTKIHEEPKKNISTKEAGDSGINISKKQISEQSKDVVLVSEKNTYQDIPPDKRREKMKFIETIKGTLNIPLVTESSLSIQNYSEQEVLFSDEDLRIIERNKMLLAKNADKKNHQQERWMLGAAVSSVYTINQSSQDGDYAVEMATLDGKTCLNIGGGLSIEYKLKSKWSLQSGFYYGKLGQLSSSSFSSYSYETKGYIAINDVLKKRGINSGSTYYNGNMNTAFGVIQIGNSSSEMASDIGDSNNDGVYLPMNGTTTTNYDQLFEYIEIPLYIKYQLLNSRVGVQLMSGVGTNILVGNSVYVNRQKVGKTLDMSGLNFSTLLGVGMRYSLTSKLYLNIEPHFKCYINSLNKNSDVTYKPYSFGLYSGISYSL